jgi:hypothetical protein
LIERSFVKMKIYDYRAVERFIAEKLEPRGYEVHQISGVLCDDYICIAPNGRYYNFCFRSKYLNEWSSGLILRKCRKLPKWAVEMLKEEDLRLAREEAEWEANRAKTA